LFEKEITELFPGQEVISRQVPGSDAFEDEGMLPAVKETGQRAAYALLIRGR